MQVTKHYEQNNVILYIEENGRQNCVTLQSDEQISRLAHCLMDIYRTEGRIVKCEPRKSPCGGDKEATQ